MGREGGREGGRRAHGGVETLITGGPDTRLEDISSWWAVPHSLNQPAATITLSLVPSLTARLISRRLFVCLERVIRTRYKWLLFIGTGETRGKGVRGTPYGKSERTNERTELYRLIGRRY